MSKLRLYGDTSGYVELEAPAVSPDDVLVLPGVAGTLATEGFVGAAVAAIPGIGSNVVQAVKTDTFSTSSASFTTVTGLTVTITPSTSASKILLMGLINFSDNSTGGGATQFRFSGGNANTFVGDVSTTKTRAFAGNMIEDQFMLYSATTVFLDSPATASAVTYNIEVRSQSGTININRQRAEVNSARDTRGASSLIAIEVAV